MQLGKLEEATTSYQNGADLAEELGDYREVAVNKGNLGAVRLDQGRYAEALAAYEDARAIFERLGEPGTVAGILLQIGVVHRKVRQFEAAERAYRQALGLFVQHKLRADEAANLGELGNLYNDWDRPEPAVAFYRQAADLYTALGDQINEGHTRSNFAETLGKLGRTDEARREIVRAIECNRPFGHTAEPWKTFNILYGIEQAAGNGVAAAAAWRQARDAYLAYRREGGYAQQPSGKILEQLLPAIQAGQGLVAAQAIIAAANDANAPLWLKALAPKLDAILSGERAPSLADDLTLGYDDSAELLLLLERLCPPGERPPVGRPTRATARLHPLPASHKLGEEP